MTYSVTASGLISIVVPAYNEADYIGTAISKISEYLDTRDIEGEIIVVDDGSSDKTQRACEEIASQNSRVRCLAHEINRGKGQAVRTGVGASRGDIVLFTDADLSTPVEEIDGLLGAFEANCDIVIGSRHLPGAEIRTPQPFMRRFMGDWFRWIARSMLNLNVSDITCGFKAFRADAARDVFERSTISGWAFDAELLVIANELGLTIREVPIVWEDCRDSRVRPISNAIEALRQLYAIRRRMLSGAYRPD